MRGLLPKHGGRGQARQFLLSDVQRLEEPISLDDAIELWDCTVDQAHELFVRGDVVPTGDPIDHYGGSTPSSRRVGAGRAATPLHPERRDPPRERWSVPRRLAAGWIGTAAAAAVLGIGVSRTRELAAARQLPGEQDAFGRWWLAADRVQLIADARAWQEQHGRTAPTWPAPSPGD